MTKDALISILLWTHVFNTPLVWVPVLFVIVLFGVPVTVLLLSSWLLFTLCYLNSGVCQSVKACPDDFMLCMAGALLIWLLVLYGHSRAIVQ
jgi:hypothetical protein